MSEHAIMDLPTGVVTFYMDTLEPRTPGWFLKIKSGNFMAI